MSPTYPAHPDFPKVHWSRRAVLILASLPIGTVITLWITTDSLQKGPCESSVFEHLPVAVDHVVCHDEFHPVAVETANEQVSLLYGRAAGAGKANAWGMLSPETQQTVPLEAWEAEWKNAAFAERMGDVTKLDGFNNYSVHYRVYEQPKSSGSGLVEHEQQFQIRSLGDGRYSIRFFGNLTAPNSSELVYPREKVTAIAKARNSPVDGGIVATLRPGQRVWLYCSLDIPGHGTWVRSSEGFAEASAITMNPDGMANTPVCDSHYATDVLNRESSAAR